LNIVLGLGVAITKPAQANCGICFHLLIEIVGAMSIFISYARDHEKQQILQLRDKLRGDGVEVVIDDDVPGGPAQGWPRWGDTQVATAQLVLVACTEGYSLWDEPDVASHKGFGVAAEAQAIRQYLYECGGSNDRILPVLFSEHAVELIPPWLRPYHRYVVTQEAGYQELLGTIKRRTSSRPPDADATVHVRWPHSDPSYPWPLANRRDQFAEFEAVITGTKKARIFCVSGEPGSGKTTFIHQLALYAQHLKLGVGLANLRGNSGLRNVLDMLDEGLGDAHRSRGERARKGILAGLQSLSAPIALLVDTYEAADSGTSAWIETKLVNNIDRFPGLIIVVGGRKLPRCETEPALAALQHHELTNIARVEDWLEYSHRRWGALLSDERIETIMLATDGDPAVMRTMLSTVAQRLSTGAL
jgi:hypothetical protein